MARERQVKVIKRVERERLEREPAGKVDPQQTPREAAREVVTTVTEWINEFRRGRRDNLTVF